MTGTTADDPFATSGLRARVLAAWSASPSRFREDANAEDDLVRGGYRDRVVVELAQNAADAASRAGVAGRLVLRLDDDRLTASNTGAPLDAGGVESLSTLRASTKRDDASATAGRFGVGFAAVLAVSDQPRVASTSGAVRWDAAAARREVSHIVALRAELDRRGGQVPVLRLPYASPDRPQVGVTTVVELPLRDAAARALVRRLLADVDDALLLALPALAEIVVEVDGSQRTVADAHRWHVVRRTGQVRRDLLADRPVEERERSAWSVTWARPLAGQPVPATLHAPTPTDEPVDLPALLIASFPLDPTRRHVAPGALTDALVVEAAAAYVEMVLGTEDTTRRLALVPGPVPAGRLDGLLRAAVVEALAVAPVLRTVDGHPVAPRDATSVVGAGEELLRALEDVVDGLVADTSVLERLGGRRLRLADAVDLLAGLDRPPSWWHGLYTALATGPLDAESLGALPVPLADGRLVRGTRGALLPGEDLPAGSSILGLRVVHPVAAHPLLLRLGAAAGTARAVLERAEVRHAVGSSWDHEDAAGLADAVLGLVAAADLRPGELPWLGALTLRDEDDEPASADELLLPGSVLAALSDPDTLDVVGPEVVARWGEQVLAAVGVLADLTVAEVHDLVLAVGSADSADSADSVYGDAPLPRLADWVTAALEQLGQPELPPSVRVLRGMRELDVVGDDGWEQLLVRVSADPQLRSVLLEPVLVELAGGGRVELPSYASWWLRTRALLHGRSTGAWARAGSAGLTGLYDELALPDGVDPAVLSAAGVRTSLETLLEESAGADELLDRLGDSSRTVPAETLWAAYRGLSGVDPGSVDPPSSIRVGPDVVVDADDAVVIDGPHHLQLPWPQPPLVVPLVRAAALADVLDVARSSERVGTPDLVGTQRAVHRAVARVLPTAPTRWWEHDDLQVDGSDVSWWVAADGEVHAATVDGLARGLAWAAGRWESRLLVAAILADPSLAEELLTESRLDGPA